MPNAETWHFLVQRITHPYEKIIIKFTSLSMLSNHRQLNGLGRWICMLSDLNTKQKGLYKFDRFPFVYAAQFCTSFSYTLNNYSAACV